MVEPKNNGQGKPKPEVEFEYQKDVDLWIKKNSQGEEQITYTEDVLEELEDDDQSETNSNN